MNWMVYFKDGKTLKGMERNIRAVPPFLRRSEGKTKKAFIDKGKSLPRVSPISVGRMMGASLMIDLNSFVGMTETEIIFKPNISFGGYKGEKAFFVNEKDEEVAFFPISEINEIAKVNKDL